MPRETDFSEVVPPSEYRSVFPSKSLTVSVHTDDDPLLPFAVCWQSEIGFNEETEEENNSITVSKYKPGKVIPDAGRNKSASKIALPYPSLQTSRSQGGLKCNVGGHHFVGEPSAVLGSTMMLGILDTDSKEVCVLPFRDVFSRMRLETQSDEDAEKERLALQKPMSVSSFSGKAKRKRVAEIAASSQKVTQNTEVVLDAEEEDVTELMQTANGDEVDVSLGEDIRPTPNHTSKVPESLYDWDNIIPSNVINALKPVAEEVSGTLEESLVEWKKTKQFTAYVLKLFSSIPKNSPVRLERFGLALCIEYVFSMFNRPPKAYKENVLLPASVPDPVKSYFFNTFTSKSVVVTQSRTFSQKQRDKMVAHLLLWILKAENFSADVSLLMAEFKARERTKIQQLATIVGARLSEKVGKDQTGFMLTLKHPWTFPKVSAGSPRKKRRT